MFGKHYVTVAQAATATAYNAEYIRRLARNSMVKSEKIGSTLLIHLPDLMRHRQAVNAKWLETGNPRGVPDPTT